jgi:pyruvate/2-oxoglutarate/acetoin dehydrogenase E1 component/TPP-dependent pyruvate/acetoin dehydrogenase alpha subunit
LYFCIESISTLSNQFDMIENSDTPVEHTVVAGSRNDYIDRVKNDLWVAMVSREASLLGRKEVLTGKAKFGILGDGKEVAQVAMAHAFKEGDWRSGYYRDQTFMFAAGLSEVEDFFAQLYADTENDPFSGGRQMNSHYATPTFDRASGEWLNHVNLKNISADISCTGGQMARALGLALASKKFKEIKGVPNAEKLSNNGNEVCFCTIGDASTSEGAFWETMNAAAVMKVPLVTAVWDDGYGISVPIELQTVKASISKAMEGFLVDEEGNGMYIYTVKGWDYPSLVATFEKVVEKVRNEHIPALIHVQEVTQPQGHSTSGSHERYKTKERLAWEREYDCIERMIGWIREIDLISADEIEEMRVRAKKRAREAKNNAWNSYTAQLKDAQQLVLSVYDTLEKDDYINSHIDDLQKMINPFYSEVVHSARRVKIHLMAKGYPIPEKLNAFLTSSKELADQRYRTHLYNNGHLSSMQVPVISPEYSDESKVLNGYQIINKFFDKKFSEDRSLLAFGEDVGKIGDVNQGFARLQVKYGKERVFDTGIREWTIVGQAIGLGIRGFRPIAEIQYLDYLLYGLAPLSDDLATLRYRSNGLQRSTAIIRTRGHRLEGIWHSGSPMGVITHSLRGMIVAVPRNMVQAAGIYNTLLQSDEPAIVVECLNGYRLKERLPDNMGEYTVPVGLPEIIREGNDITLVTYGSCIRPAIQGCEYLEKLGISVELIDVQTLLPFDTEKVILGSLMKTNKLVVMDEDVPGAATGYMLREILEEQGGYDFLDAKPITISAPAHRPPYGTDGDYFSKPQSEDVFDVIYEMMEMYDPGRFR